jgi:hypothetical protein
MLNFDSSISSSIFKGGRDGQSPALLVLPFQAISGLSPEQIREHPSGHPWGQGIGIANGNAIRTKSRISRRLSHNMPRNMRYETVRQYRAWLETNYAGPVTVKCAIG